MSRVKSALLFAFAATLYVNAAQAQWSGASDTTPISRSGNVGIFVASPQAPLDIAGSMYGPSAKLGSFEIQSYSVNNAWLGENVYYDASISGFRRRAAGGGSLTYHQNGAFAIRTFSDTNSTVVGGPTGAGSSVSTTQSFIVKSDGSVGIGGGQVQGSLAGASVVINPAGNLGIGTASPGVRLDVAGDAHVTGNLVADGNIAAKYQDVAEWVPSAQPLTAGSVVVLDTTTANRVTTSSTAYDTRVAGVVSAQPGLILGQRAADKEKVATTGRVQVKVTGPVAIGDLLVTAAREGYAMRSEPIDIGGRKFHQPGTIIGKALEAHANGDGEILVLLSLQ